MTERDCPARHIVEALRENGTEGVISDEPAPVRVSTAMGTTIVPGQLATVESAREEFVVGPPAGSLVVRIGVLASGSIWRSADLSEAYGALGTEQAHDKATDVPALHATDTVDAVTVVLDEIHAILEPGEVHLRQGDTLVQLGSRHARSNRGYEPVVLVFTQIAARSYCPASAPSYRRGIPHHTTPARS